MEVEVESEPVVQIELRHLQKLWEAAQCHCVAMCGSYLDPEDGPPEDHDCNKGDWNPALPEDPNEVIETITEYLVGSI